MIRQIASTMRGFCGGNAVKKEVVWYENHYDRPQNKVDEVYGKEWRKPYTTLYKE